MVEPNDAEYEAGFRSLYIVRSKFPNNGETQTAVFEDLEIALDYYNHMLKSVAARAEFMGYSEYVTLEKIVGLAKMPLPEKISGTSK